MVQLQAGTSYMLREYSSKERKVADLLELKVGPLYGTWISSTNFNVDRFQSRLESLHLEVKMLNSKL